MQISYYLNFGDNTATFGGRLFFINEHISINLTLIDFWEHLPWNEWNTFLEYGLREAIRGL